MKKTTWPSTQPTPRGPCLPTWPLVELGAFVLEHAHGHVLILSKNSMLADGYRKKYTNILHQSQHNNILFSPITTHSSIIPPITSQNFHFPILSSIHTILSSIHTIIHTYYQPYQHYINHINHTYYQPSLHPTPDFTPNPQLSPLRT